MRNDSAHMVRTAHALLTSLEGRVAMLPAEGVRLELVDELQQLLHEVRATLQQLP